MEYNPLTSRDQQLALWFKIPLLRNWEQIKGNTSIKISYICSQPIASFYSKKSKSRKKTSFTYCTVHTYVVTPERKIFFCSVWLQLSLSHSRNNYHGRRKKIPDRYHPELSVARKKNRGFMPGWKMYIWYVKEQRAGLSGLLHIHK